MLNSLAQIVVPGQSRKPGQIYDSNKTSLLSVIKSEGFAGKDGGIALDR